MKSISVLTTLWLAIAVAANPLASPLSNSNAGLERRVPDPKGGGGGRGGGGGSRGSSGSSSTFCPLLCDQGAFKFESAPPVTGTEALKLNTVQNF